LSPAEQRADGPRAREPHFAAGLRRSHLGDLGDLGDRSERRERRRDVARRYSASFSAALCYLAGIGKKARGSCIRAG
jgi:hypothetical protein